jgi:hypothetical protein
MHTITTAINAYRRGGLEKKTLLKVLIKEIIFSVKRK